MIRTNAIRKLKTKSGVTIGETLVALIFCLMTFALVCTAIAAAGRELKALSMQSEAAMLCGTLTTAVEDELRFAQYIEGTDIDSIVYTNSGRASNHLKVSFKNDEGRIVLYNTSDGKTTKIILIPDANYTQGMKASLELNWNNKDGSASDYCFTGKVSVTDSKDNTLCNRSFAVRPVNY